MDKVDYVTKMEKMINNGIQKACYVDTEDTTLRDPKRKGNPRLPLPKLSE